MSPAPDGHGGDEGDESQAEREQQRAVEASPGGGEGAAGDEGRATTAERPGHEADDSESDARAGLDPWACTHVAALAWR